MLIIPAAGGLIAYWYNGQAERRAMVERRGALYAELLSKREEADTAVRRGVFDKVLEKYFNPDVTDIDGKLVALDLMVSNFHESLNLTPLFWQLDREIGQEPVEERRQARRLELERIAREVVARQIEVLSLVGKSKQFNINLQQDAQTGSFVPTHECDLEFIDPLDRNGKPLKRHFQFDVIEPDPKSRRIGVIVRVDGVALRESIWVDLYDFPLASFTRISPRERFALVLQRMQTDIQSADLTLVYYPSARGGIKDKPFIDEVLDNMVNGVAGSQ